MNFNKYILLVPLDLRVYVEGLFRKKYMRKVIIPLISKTRIDTIILLRHKYTRVYASHQLDDYFYWRRQFISNGYIMIDDQLSSDLDDMRGKDLVEESSCIPIFIDSKLRGMSVEENEMFYNYLIFVKYSDEVNQCPITTLHRS